MKWGDDAVGVVLTRNEIWLLLHALSAGPKPVLGWDGSELEPWVIGELQRRLKEVLRPETVKDVDVRPVIRIDSEMGQNLVLEGIRPMVTSDAYDLGTLFHACAERAWGAEVVLPPGAIDSTPATADRARENRRRERQRGRCVPRSRAAGRRPCPRAYRRLGEFLRCREHRHGRRLI